MTRRPTISVAMLALIYVALGLVALRESDEAWTSLVVTLTLLILTAATLRLIVQPGPERPFWQGFVLFGWVLFIAMFILTGAGGGTGRMLATSLLLDQLSELVHPDIARPGSPSVVQYVGARFRPLSAERLSFLMIGHCYVTLLFATLGGLLGLAMSRESVPTAKTGREN